MKDLKKTKLPIQGVRLRHFKAVRDSGQIMFTPLTVFIGNNGVGKSSIIEGLETFRSVVLRGIDEAFLPWRGFEQIWNNAVSHALKENKIGRLERTNPMLEDRVGSDPAKCLIYQPKVGIKAPFRSLEAAFGP
jgi:AAA ATPase domain